MSLCYGDAMKAQQALSKCIVSKRVARGCSVVYAKEKASFRIDREQCKSIDEGFENTFLAAEWSHG